MADRARAAAGHAVDRRRGRGRTTSPTARARRGTANYIDGTVSRVDPRTNKVTARPDRRRRRRSPPAPGRRGSAPPARPRRARCRRTVCGELVAGGGTPDVLIVSDLPLQGPDGADPRAMPDAIRLVLEAARLHGGRFTVGYRSCDDSTAQTGNFENRRCAANANAYATRRRAGGGDRAVQLLLRRGRAPDPQPRPGRAAGDDQPDEHVRRPHARQGLRPRTATAASRTSTTRPASATTCGSSARDDLQGGGACRAREALGLDARLPARTTARASGRRCSRTRSARGRGRLGVGGRRRGERTTRQREELRRARRRGSPARGADGVVSAATRTTAATGCVKALRARLGAAA